MDALIPDQANREIPSSGGIDGGSTGSADNNVTLLAFSSIGIAAPSAWAASGLLSQATATC